MDEIINKPSNELENTNDVDSLMDAED